LSGKFGLNVYRYVSHTAPTIHVDQIESKKKKEIWLNVLATDNI